MAGETEVISLTQRLGAGAARRREFARSCGAFLKTSARLLGMQGAALSVVSGESELVLAGFGIRLPDAPLKGSPAVNVVAAPAAAQPRPLRTGPEYPEIPLRAEDGNSFSYYLGIPCPSPEHEKYQESIVLALFADEAGTPVRDPSPEQMEALAESASEQVRQALLRLDYESFRREMQFSRLIRESIDDAIIVTEAESREGRGPRIIFVNEAFVRMTGYQPAEVIGKTPQLLAGPDTDPVELDRLRSAIAEKQPARAELLNYRRDGSEFWVEINISPVADESGRHTHWVSIQRETTERHNFEARLKDLASRLETALESTTDHVMILDPDWKITYINTRGRAMLNLDTDLTGAHFWETFPEVQGSKFGEEFLHAMRENLPVHVLEYYAPLGKWFDAHAYPSSRGLTIFARDVTQQKRLEQELERAQKMEAVGQFAGSIAHDFNNLLTVINGYTRMMLRRGRGDDPHRRDLEAVCDAGARAVHLTQQLLAFGRQQVMNTEVVELNAVVGGFGSIVAGVLPDDIEVTTTLAPAPGNVRIDPHQFEQVILNLVVNARDAMPRGGRLTIETANVVIGNQDAQLQSGPAPGRYAVLIISDTGTGMTPEILGRIFEPFFTTKPKGQGTGLGLPTAFGIVKQSGGHIEAESEPGRGSTFRVYLPITDEAPSASPELKDAGIEPAIATLQNTETILVVEDDVRVRDFTETALTAFGYTVLSAQNADRALRISEQHSGPIHLLLTDVVLPETSGRDLAGQIRRKRTETAVLYMSGYTREALISRGEIEPEYGYLQKPFLPEGLAAAVRGALGPVLRRSVMVVDDEAAVRDYLKRTISEAGYDVTTVGDGDEALRIFRNAPADLVLTDLVMPEKEGIETIQSLKREDPNLRIIAMSGAVSGPILAAAKYLGANEVMQKPIAAEDLVRLLRKLIG
ncbi:MAG: response regulator [Blastocatellales bacterium]|nr:response regulator [Blastocatellales bacterium]